MLFLIHFVAHTLKVEVGLLYDLPVAKSVATEPLTPDDWEILVCMQIYIASRLVPHLFLRNYMQNTWSPPFYLRFASPHLTRRSMFGYSAALVSVYVFVRGYFYFNIHTMLKPSQFRLNHRPRELSCFPTILNSQSRRKPAVSGTRRSMLSTRRHLRLNPIQQWHLLLPECLRIPSYFACYPPLCFCTTSLVRQTWALLLSCPHGCSASRVWKAYSHLTQILPSSAM